MLLCAAVAGCASVAPDTAYAAKATKPIAAVGCASVSQATVVTIHRITHPVKPIRVGPDAAMAQRKPTLARALFGDFCQVVAHAYVPKTPVHCPVSFGLYYAGTFYDGQRVLATFTYGATGCQSVNLTAAGKSRYSLVMGPAAAAAPHLEADLAAVLGRSVAAVYSSPQQVNPGGPDKTLRQVA